MAYEPLCSICQNPYRPRKVTEMFCNSCYNNYKDEIISKAPWVQYCVANEQARRNWDSYIKQGKRVWVELVYLNNDDLYQEAGKYKVLHKFDNDGD